MTVELWSGARCYISWLAECQAFCGVIGKARVDIRLLWNTIRPSVYHVIEVS